MTLRPATPEELAEALHAAHESRSRIERVDLSALTRVLEHTPEDMTVTVEAGATLASLQQRLAVHRQWLPIDPPNPGRLTLAALLDDNASGPRRYGCGTIRDHLIGVRVALADGRLIRSGGKVVKNVAGYDLMKLFIGARGTLGVIVEATFKLLPLPEAEAFVQRRCETIELVEPLITAVLDSELTPTVLDLDNSNPQPAPGDGQTLILGFSGPRLAVEWQLALARKLGFTEPATLDFDARFHAPDQPAAQRLSVLPSRLVETLRSIGSVPFVARAGNGIVFHRAGIATPKPDAPCVLSRRVKQTFDPNGILPELPL